MDRGHISLKPPLISTLCLAVRGSVLKNVGVFQFCTFLLIREEYERKGAENSRYVLFQLYKFNKHKAVPSKQASTRT